MEQLSLRYGYTQEYLEGLLSTVSGKTVSLKLTENSSRMVSVLSDECAASVRVHRIFLEAEADVIRELALFVKGRRGKTKTPLINRFITEKCTELRGLGRRPGVLRPAGRHHDLAGAYESINEEYFGGAIDAAVTWGRTGRGRARAVKRRVLGSYSFSTNTIRINPVLDSPEVPEYYLRFILYHEMLHASVGIDGDGRRRSIHPRRFRDMERLFKDYQRAMDWERTRGA